MNRFSDDGTVKAHRMMEKAVECDPNFGTAQAFLALFKASPGWWEGDERPFAERSLPIALRAVELDPDDSVSRALLGILYLYLRDFDKAEFPNEGDTGMERRPTAILAADVACYSRLLAEDGGPPIKPSCKFQTILRFSRTSTHSSLLTSSLGQFGSLQALQPPVYIDLVLAVLAFP